MENIYTHIETESALSVRHFDIVIIDNEQSHRRISWRPFFQVLTILVFIAGFTIPMIGSFIRTNRPLDESRDPHPAPPIAFKKHVIQDYPKWFELYYGDHVGYRDWMIDVHRRIMLNYFDTSTSELVWIGKDGWLFLNVADPYRHRSDKPTVPDRVATWAAVLKQRQQKLAQLGIQYIVCITPEKATVYPEYLRGSPLRHPPPEPALLLTQLLEKQGVICVNPLPEMLQVKSTHPHQLYFQTDTHWNPEGGRIAYRQLRNQIQIAFPDYVPVAESDWERQQRFHQGDLCRIAGETATAEAYWDYLPQGRSCIQDGDPSFAKGLPAKMKPDHMPPWRYRCPEASGPRTLLLRDSYAEAMLPFLRTDFPELSVIATHDLPMALIQVEKPQLVIQQIVARFLYLTEPIQPE